MPSHAVAAAGVRPRGACARAIVIAPIVLLAIAAPEVPRPDPTPWIVVVNSSAAPARVAYVSGPLWPRLELAPGACARIHPYPVRRAGELHLEWTRGDDFHHDHVAVHPGVPVTITLAAGATTSGTPVADPHSCPLHYIECSKCWIDSGGPLVFSDDAVPMSPPGNGRTFQ